jgi:hypothetical protein
MASKRYVQLEKRIKQLRNIFLPRKFSPTGTYSVAQYDKVRAFRVLAHSEIESYIEYIAKELAIECVKQFKDNNIILPPIIGIVNRYGKGISQIDNCLSGHITTIGSNNGIKEENINKLLSPIGCFLDSSILSMLNSYSSVRGEIAHTSSSVQRPIDPRDELETITEILKDLEGIDNYYNAILDAE